MKSGWWVQSQDLNLGLQIPGPLSFLLCSAMAYYLKKEAHIFIFKNCTCSWTSAGNSFGEDAFPYKFLTNLFWQLFLGPAVTFNFWLHTWPMVCLLWWHLDWGTFCLWSLDSCKNGLMGGEGSLFSWRGLEPLCLPPASLIILLSCSERPPSHNFPSTHRRTYLRIVRVVVSPEGIEEDGYQLRTGPVGSLGGSGKGILLYCRERHSHSGGRHAPLLRGCHA